VHLDIVVELVVLYPGDWTDQAVYGTGVVLLLSAKWYQLQY